MMVEDLPPRPLHAPPEHPPHQTARHAEQSPWGKEAQRASRPPGTRQASSPFGAKAPSQRALAFAQAVAKQRATTEDNWAVLQKATQCLDTLLAAFDPSEAPHKHKLATEANCSSRCHDHELP